MQNLSDELLIETYYKAVNLDLSLILLKLFVWKLLNVHLGIK